MSLIAQLGPLGGPLYTLPVARISGGASLPANLFIRNLRRHRGRRANTSRLLRKASRHGASSLSHFAANASGAAGAPAFGSVHGNRHPDCDRVWVLGAWTLLGCVPYAVWRAAIRNIAAANSGDESERGGLPPLAVDHM
jgi:hypothetical protein